MTKNNLEDRSRPVLGNTNIPAGPKIIVSACAHQDINSPACQNHIGVYVGDIGKYNQGRIPEYKPNNN